MILLNNSYHKQDTYLYKDTIKLCGKGTFKLHCKDLIYYNMLDTWNVDLRRVYLSWANERQRFGYWCLKKNLMRERKINYWTMSTHDPLRVTFGVIEKITQEINPIAEVPQLEIIVGYMKILTKVQWYKVGRPTIIQRL